MKILKTLLNKICLTLAIGLFFIGCSDLSLEKNWSVLNGKGKIVISTNFSDINAKTVLPTPFSTELLGYKWVLYAQISNSATQIEVKSWEDTKDENNTSILAYNNMLNDDYIFGRCWFLYIYFNCL